MRAGGFEMRSLLDQAGFRIRGATRADCVHCNGHSRGTVAFTAEVAYCHRCKWTANNLMLARELGLLSIAPATRQALERERRVRLETPIRAFEQWRDAELRRVTDEYRVLTRQAALAESVMKIYPDCEPAWDALATFYDRQAALTAELDRLSCAKLSDFLEVPSTIEQLFGKWSTKAHAA